MFLARRMQLAAAGTGEYVINNSVYPDGSTGYFSRTPGSAGNQTTWTFSCWIKPTLLTGAQALFSGRSASSANEDYIYINGGTPIDGGAHTLVFRIRGTSVPSYAIRTTQVFRDPSAWQHVVAVYDSDNATSGDRMRLYINGTRVTALDEDTQPPSGTQSFINSAQEHRLLNFIHTSGFWAGYASEIIFIDGQALTPSSFGETDSVTGIWKPKSYSGSYGTNGFRLDFADSADLGNDVSGNNNDFTKNGTVTQTTDSPTDKAASNVGNFATFNPLDKLAAATLSNGNRTFAVGTSSPGGVRSTIGFEASTANFFAEFVWDSGTGVGFGISKAGSAVTAGHTGSIMYVSSGDKRIDGSDSAYGASWTTGDVIGVRVLNGEINFYKNGADQGVAASGLSGVYHFWVQAGSNDANQISARFANNQWTNAPSGARSLSTANLPEPTIKDPSAHFQVTLWTGDGNATKEINQSGNSTFQPDLVWTKNRTTALSHYLFDAVRGVNKGLHSDDNSAEIDSDSFGYVSAFDADGFTVQKGSQTNSYTNKSGDNYVAWLWKANGSGVSNTDGSLSSTVSVNSTAKMSIVKFTMGTSASTAYTIGHGLGTAPKLVILKGINGANTSWHVYNGDLGTNKAMILNTTDAVTTSTLVWNNTAPTSSVFSINTGYWGTDGFQYIAYCFAEVEGFSKFGTYTGNGNADGPFIYCGFKPELVIVKNTTTGVTAWLAWDGARNTYNDIDVVLFPDDSGAEATDADMADFVSNGFKLRDTPSNRNENGSTFIYMAFAKNPFGGSKTTQARAR